MEIQNHSLIRVIFLILSQPEMRLYVVQTPTTRERETARARARAKESVCQDYNDMM